MSLSAIEEIHTFQGITYALQRYEIHRDRRWPVMPKAFLYHRDWTHMSAGLYSEIKFCNPRKCVPDLFIAESAW